MKTVNLNFAKFICSLCFITATVVLNANAQNLYGDWRLTEMKSDGVKTALNSNKLPVLTIDSAKNAYGNSGCNNYTTTYQLQKKQISFKPAASTRMACIGEVSNLIEITYFKTLAKIEKYKLSNKTLTLYDKNNGNILKFTKIPVKIEG